MAVRRPLIRDPADGRIKELPTGESVAGASGLSFTPVDCDFGTEGFPAKNFDIADAAALTTQQIVTMVPLVQPGGVPSDELEMDPLAVVASVPVNGTVRLLIVSVGGGTICGLRRVAYALI